MRYQKFNELGLSDEKVEEIAKAISEVVASDVTTVDDANTQFIICERMKGAESRGLLLRVKSSSSRFHFFVNLWRKPVENGRLRLKAYLEDLGANEWQFMDSDIVLSVRNKKGKNPTHGNVFYFVPSDSCHCSRFSINDFYECRESIARLAKSILGRMNGVNYFTVDYSACRLAEEDHTPAVSQGLSVATCDGAVKKVKPMKIGNFDSAEVLFDSQRWVRVEYGDDVKRLSEIGDGVHSWVSTVEDLAKKSPVKINGISIKPGTLMIPPYQRKFAWREHDVRQLCRDLLKTDDEGHYHLGTIILHHQRMDDGREIWNVVDGQQRLTNIMAILRAPIFGLPIKQFLARDYEMICQVLADYSGEDQTKIRSRLSRCTLAFISVENVTEAFQLFTTQNGRGKPLTPVNLLKAYHYKEMDLDRQEMTEEDFDKLLKETEQSWESANVASISFAPGDGKLLLHVFREYLFRLRLWSRGKFPQVPFSARDIGEFKGVSIKTGEQGLPLQNGAVLRRSAAGNGDYVAHRRNDDAMSPYVSICQTIVNGADFFKYVRSYIDAYKDVFCDGRVKEFHDFYMKNCVPRIHRSGAAMYARHVFEALCMFCYDRFGAEGLRKCFPALYACAYYERVSQSRVLYRKCGATYVPKAMEAMMTTFSAEDAQLALNELRTEIRLVLGNSSYLKSLLKKDNPTKGEARQLAAYRIIAG